MKALILMSALLFMGNAFAQDILYKVLYAKGDAYFTREDSRRKIVKGDLLMSNDVIQTEADGLVVLSFGDDYKSKMKVTNNSEIKLEPMGEMEEEGNKLKTQSMYVQLGNIVIEYVNKDKKKNRLNIKTKSALMGIRGTMFFVHVTPDNDTAVAVHNGVVAVKHEKNHNVVVLNNKQGVVMSEDVAHDKMDNPKWFVQVNWSFTALDDDFKKLYHGKGFSGEIERILYKASSAKGMAVLKEDQKVLQKECYEKKAVSCGKLALQLLADRDEGDTQQVRKLFKRGCENGDQRSCIWIGRTEYEFGDKARGKKFLDDLCQKKKMSYGCYMMWEISQKEADDPQAEFYLKKSTEQLQNIEDFDKTLAEFSTMCDTNDSIACTNIGILLDSIKQKDRARSYYEKACEMGDGDACSNLGLYHQEKGDLDTAQKFYQKSCYLNTSTGCYNLACVYSRRSNLSLSVQYLKMAIINGYVDWEQMAADEDLVNLRKTEDYQSVLKEFKK